MDIVLSKLKKALLVFVILEILILIGSNIYAGKIYQDMTTKEYRVEISRIKSKIENGTDFQDIDLGDYERVVAINIFDPNENSTNEYTVEKINDTLYRFEYVKGNLSRLLVIMNCGFVTFILLTFGIFIYIERKIVNPFSRMNSVTKELSKGNLTVPIKQEKSKYFKDFIWGLDMLRDKLESDKNRELELLKEKKLMVLSLSHDIKTPLSASDLYVKALKKGLYATEEEKDIALSGIEKNLSEIKNYVNEIANASREDIVSLEVNNGELYLDNLISEIKKYYQEKCSNLHIDLRIENMENCLLRGDFDRIVEVLQNAIENAIKYGDGEWIKISSYEEEGCKILEVSNSGCELKEEELTNIFDSFYRGSNVKNKEGSGLGLYISKELMHKMDGDVFANIKDGIFTVSLVIQKM